MRQLRRLLFYLVINIIVSAATILIVLNLLERQNPVIPATTEPVAQLSPSVTPLSPQSTPLESPPVEATQETLPTEQASEPVPPTPTISLTPYQVQAGDTLGTIAIQFEISVADILAVNEIDDPDTLSVGQILYIPGGHVPLPPGETATSVPTEVPSPTPLPSVTPTPGASPTPAPTLSGEEPGVIIVAVISAGDLENERIMLARTGDGELSLAGWQLEDSDGNVYIFPQLDLYAGGAVNLHTRAGTNTVVDLYWGMTAPAWRSGELIVLRDAQGNERATYQVP